MSGIIFPITIPPGPMDVSLRESRVFFSLSETMPVVASLPVTVITRKSCRKQAKLKIVQAHISE